MGKGVEMICLILIIYRDFLSKHDGYFPLDVSFRRVLYVQNESNKVVNMILRPINYQEKSRESCCSLRTVVLLWEKKLHYVLATCADEYIRIYVQSLLMRDADSL